MKPLAPTHPCALCDRLVPRLKLMCAPHWHQVPADLQRAVYSGWRELQAQKSLDSLKTYRQAVLDAVASVPSPQSGESP